MNALDWETISFLNSYAQHSYVFDKAMALIASNVIFKGGVIIPLLWWLWFQRDSDGQQKEYLLTTLAIAFFALFVARFLALTLPFRPRPLHNATLAFTLPFGTKAGTLDGWSAFPSDHAVLFFALATGIFFLSRKAGVYAFIHAILIISFPRIYLGLHHVTDILGGAVIGVAMACLVRWDWLRQLISIRMLTWERAYPGLFYASLLVVSYQLIYMFEPLRDAGSYSLNMVRYYIHGATFVAGAK